MGSPFRIQPAMGAGSYKTYQIEQPRTEKTRIGSCQAASCPNYERGWRTTIDPATALGKEQERLIRASGRRWTEALDGGLLVFTFYPGQQCFRIHHVADRPQLFSVRAGDWRANLGGIRQHTQAQHWVEDFAEHQQQLADRLEKG